MNDISEKKVDRVFERLDKYAELHGYHLNPDTSFTKDLIRSLLINQKRYGYWACPCRLASGKREEDKDIICPCVYRDPDVKEYGACYCALYVSKEIVDGRRQAGPIPERRPSNADRKEKKEVPLQKASVASLPLPVWRCRVCGYLCARDEPPEVCPICKAKKDRFERFM